MALTPEEQRELDELELKALEAKAGRVAPVAAGPAPAGPRRDPRDRNPQLGYTTVADEKDAAARSAQAKTGTMMAAIPAAMAAGGAPLAPVAGMAMLVDLIRQNLAGRGAGSSQPVRIGETLQQGVINGAPIARGANALVKNVIGQGAAGVAGEEVRSMIDEGKRADINRVVMAAAAPAAVAPVGHAVSLAGRVAGIRGTPVSTGNASKDAVLKRVREAGFIVPESDNYADRLLRGLAGKDAVRQGASIKNNELADVIAKKANGIAPGDDLSNAAMASIRKRAVASGYDPIRKIDSIATDDQYLTDLAAIADPQRRALPGVGRVDIGEAVKPLEVPAMTGGQALDTIAVLRQKSKAAASSATPDYELSRSYRAAADAIEAQIDRHLAGSGGDGAAVLANYRKARADIARSSSTEDALRGGISVIPAELGTMSQNKVPLSNGMETIGEFANHYPRYAQEASKIPTPGVSKIQASLAGGMGLGTFLQSGSAPAALAAAGAAYTPDLARAAVLSRPYQRAVTTEDPAAVATVIRTLRAMLNGQRQ